MAVLAGLAYSRSFLKAYGLGAVGFSLLILCVAVQWSMIVESLLHGEVLRIGFTRMMRGYSAAAAVLVSFGALIGKVDALQILTLVVIEIPCYCWNKVVFLQMDGPKMPVVHDGRGLSIFLFGSFFGFAAGKMLGVSQMGWLNRSQRSTVGQFEQPEFTHQVVNAARDRVGEYEFRELEHEEKMKRATKKILKDKNLHVGMIMLLSNLYQAAGEPVGSGMRGGETTQTIDWTWIVFVVCAALGALSTMNFGNRTFGRINALLWFCTGILSLLVHPCVEISKQWTRDLVAMNIFMLALCFPALLMTVALSFHLCRNPGGDINSLWFSANLRLPKSYSRKEKEELVEKTLKELGLEKCADTYIGDDMIRGVSGGEKKRTCVGIELIMKPKLIFLDEPTSGLDSYAAHNVVMRLKDMAAHDGCNVLCTIHQPSSEVFHQFNSVMVLRSGKRFYFGPLSGLSTSLHAAGKGCPNEFNLADHVMFVLQTESSEALDKIEMQMQEATPASQHPEMPHDKSVMTMKLEGAHAGFFTQLAALTKREFQNVYRDKAGLIASILVPLILNVFFALIFFQVGNIDRSEWTAQAHFGGMTQVAIGGMFGAAQPLLLKFPLDRGIFLREYATQTYGAAPYFISKSMAKASKELPQSFLNACITWGAAYFIMGLQGSFIMYVLIFWITGVAAASTALLVGCLAANPEVAQQAAPAVFVPQLLFAGFFIQSEQIPVWLRWAQYLCALKYGASHKSDRLTDSQTLINALLCLGQASALDVGTCRLLLQQLEARSDFLSRSDREGLDVIELDRASYYNASVHVAGRVRALHPVDGRMEFVLTGAQTERVMETFGAMKSSAALLRIPAPRLLLQAVIRWLDLTQAKHDPVGCHPGRVVHCLGMIRKQLPGMEIGQQVNFKPQVGKKGVSAVDVQVEGTVEPDEKEEEGGALNYVGVLKKLQVDANKKAFGFILCESDAWEGDVFVSKKVLESHKDLKLGDKLRFSVKVKKNKAEAVKLELISAPDEDEEVSGPDMLGSIKSFDESSGYGFIRSAQAMEAYSRDVFLHRKQLRHFKVGDTVQFKVKLSRDGLPQALKLRETDQVLPPFEPHPTEESKVPEKETFLGEIKSFSPINGFGFIQNSILREKYGRDVFLHESQFEGLKIGDSVRFVLQIKDGKPQALEVKRVSKKSLTSPLMASVPAPEVPAIESEEPSPVDPAVLEKLNRKLLRVRDLSAHRVRLDPKDAAPITT
eukprot:g12024.t1